MFEHKCSLVLTGIAVLYLLLLHFMSGFFTAIALLHIHTCAVHMKMSLLKRDVP